LNTQRKHNGWIISFAALMLAVVACTCADVPGPSDAPVALDPDLGGPTLTPIVGENGELSQWASTANASSQYGDTSWSALQAAGEPNTTDCGDYSTAWATGASNGVDWIELSYPVAVIPTTINIHHTYNPGAVVKVEVVDAEGTAHSIYDTQPEIVDQCPIVETLDLTPTGIDFPVAKIIIHLDQTNHPGWDEIDAVQLIGTP
jgi:hypothetical protein